MKKNKFPQVKLTVWLKNGRAVYYPYSTRMNRLYARARHGLYVRIDVRVQYGIAKNINGKEEMFYNDGTYTDPKEVVEVLKAFLE